ncbi:MAG: hypothetical protein ACE15C_20710 [Phycisphaerae bacterium]
MKTFATVMILGCAILGGCSPALPLPPGFVDVGRDNLGPYSQRAVSADGVVIAIRTEDNPKNATLDFWAPAIRDELVDRRGYTLVREEPVTSGALGGKLMIFSSQRSGVEFTYLAAVYVKGSQVVIAEAGGKREAVTPKVDAIRKSLCDVRYGGM